MKKIEKGKEEEEASERGWGGGEGFF